MTKTTSLFVSSWPSSSQRSKEMVETIITIPGTNIPLYRVSCDGVSFRIASLVYIIEKFSRLTLCSKLNGSQLDKHAGSAA